MGHKVGIDLVPSAFKDDNVDIKDDSNLESWSNSFRERWDKISLESPTVPKKLWKRKLNEEKKRLNEKLHVQ